jgi:hypothetical protein
LPTLRYDEELLSRLQPDAGVWVKNLCGKPDSVYAALANTIERWFIELRCNKRMLANLSSPEDTTFLAALWELTAARLFHNAGFKVEFEPTVEQTIPEAKPKTPDFRATRGDIDPLVEVLNLNPSAYEQLEEERRARLAQDLQSRLSLSGNLTLALKQGVVLDPYPTSIIIDNLARAVEEWWHSGHQHYLRIDDPPVRLFGTWKPNGDVLDVFVGPEARFLSADRIRTALETKLGRYRDLAAEQLLIFVGSDYWTHSVDTMITAMFGETRVSLAKDENGNPIAGSEFFSGEGLMTDHPIFGHRGGRLVAGCFFARHASFNAESGFFDLNVEFVHNPLAAKALPNGFLHPIPEFQWSTEGGGWAVQIPMALPMELR